MIKLKINKTLTEELVKKITIQKKRRLNWKK